MRAHEILIVHCLWSPEEDILVRIIMETKQNSLLTKVEIVILLFQIFACEPIILKEILIDILYKLTINYLYR